MFARCNSVGWVGDEENFVGYYSVSLFRQNFARFYLCFARYYCSGEQREEPSFGEGLCVHLAYK